MLEVLVIIACFVATGMATFVVWDTLQYILTKADRGLFDIFFISVMVFLVLVSWILCIILLFV